VVDIFQHYLRVLTLDFAKASKNAIIFLGRNAYQPRK